MAKTVTKTGTKAKLISKPKYIVATIGAGTENEKNYIFEHVLKDSTKFSQDDPTTNQIDNEVSDTPIKTNVTLGSYQFEATIEDIQEDLLIDLCGFTKATKSGVVYAPASYVEKNVQIAVVLDSGAGDNKLVAFVAPSVQLNSKLILESLSTSMAGFTLAGTAKTASVTVGSSSNTDSISTPLYINYDYTLPVQGS